MTNSFPPARMSAARAALRLRRRRLVEVPALTLVGPRAPRFFARPLPAFALRACAGVSSSWRTPTLATRRACCRRRRRARFHEVSTRVRESGIPEDQVRARKAARAAPARPGRRQRGTSSLAHLSFSRAPPGPPAGGVRDRRAVEKGQEVRRARRAGLRAPRRGRWHAAQGAQRTGADTRALASPTRSSCIRPRWTAATSPPRATRRPRCRRRRPRPRPHPHHHPRRRRPSRGRRRSSSSRRRRASSCSSSWPRCVSKADSRCARQWRLMRVSARA